MTIIKEFYKGREQNLVILRLRNYGLSIDSAFNLFSAAVQDFPELKSEDAKIVHYGGRHYKGTFGIEFDVPFSVAMPTGYTEVGEPELVL